MSKHVENWDFYFSNIDNKIAEILVDLGYDVEKRKKNYDNLLWISVEMNNHEENGLSSNEENENLENLGNDLIPEIKKYINSLFCGRVTSDNYRTFYFYACDLKDVGTILKKFFNKFKGYKYTYEFKRDRNWDAYHNLLYPTPREHLSIQNRHTVNSLELYGDTLIEPRRVDHWIYFKLKKDGNKFLKKISKLKFEVESFEKNDADDECPYTLHIYRTDKVDYTSIDDFTLTLFDYATELNATYDGWETKVVK